MDVGTELPGRIEASAADAFPGLLIEDLAIQLELPDNFQRLALCVVVQAGQTHQSAGGRSGFNRFDEVRAGPNTDDFACFGQSARGIVTACRLRKVTSPLFRFAPLISALEKQKSS